MRRVSTWGGQVPVCLLALVLAAVAGTLVPLQAQVSPGPLSKAHHGLDSPLKCGSCHAFGAGAAKLRCLTCHQEIRELLAQHEGYHGRMASRANGDQDCARCHTEHYGANFQIFQWPTSKDEFDHRTTGYPLVGRHAGLACEKCHNAPHISEADRKKIAVKNLSHTFEGLHQACLICHEDRHNGQLGPKCERCHDESNWKTVKTFDHSSTKFPLTGKHEDVACAKCHKPAPANAKVIQYTGLDFATCTGCHQDPHRGSFAARCESCHNTGSWKRVSIANQFDHSRTRFPLSGKHEGLACAKCHQDSNFKNPVAHEKCMDCHQDWHKGQFAGRSDRGECGVCHTDQGWKPSTFTEASHRESRYPLTGRHSGLACAKCHVPAGRETNYRPSFKVCLDCHRDPHGGQLASGAAGRPCEDCHNVGGFKPSLYTLAQHQSAAFALKGAHAAVPCLDCHKQEDAPPGADRRFRYPVLTCVSCHRDPHRGEYPPASKAGLATGQSICETCHTLISWHELKPYDHAATGFHLEGSHAVLRCGDCHRWRTMADASRDLPFKAAPERCEGCHEDIHAGQFQQGKRTAGCAECHGVTRWSAEKFDHNKGSTFSLAGAHEDVPCRLCHDQRKEINGRSVVIYKNTPRECAACHR